MKVIRAGTLISLLRSVLDANTHDPIKWDEDIGLYVTGGGGALAAFAQRLNGSPQFSGYGLALSAGDLAQVKTMRGLVNAIGAWFEGDGWTITL